MVWKELTPFKQMTILGIYVAFLVKHNIVF